MTTRPDSPTPAWKTRRFRLLVLFGAITVLALILVLQNFDTTEVQFLFWRAEAPLAWVLLTFMALGAGVEFLIRLLVRRKRTKRAERTSLQDGSEDR
ncbi:MAG: hypothetical protein A2Z12_01075 [Actinobacteria bacterium RBG_16_68_21]|nr:MAG: hypothetical protein A2Z12_01075 [Actinobacteria bacterium RBG_16_68_21]